MGPACAGTTKEFLFINIKFFELYLIPVPKTSLILRRVLSNEGRFMRRSEVGQSESLAGAG